jgi:hypothetical protein
MSRIRNMLALLLMAVAAFAAPRVGAHEQAIGGYHCPR